MGGIQATPKKYVTNRDRWRKSTQCIHQPPEMATISIGSEDSILLQQCGFKEIWTRQHADNFKEFSLVAEKQKVALMAESGS